MFKDQMSEDILHRREQEQPNIIAYDIIYDEAIQLIDDIVYSISGRHVADYGLPAPRIAFLHNNEVRVQLNYDADALAVGVRTALPTLNNAQRCFYDAVMEKVDANDPAIFFLNACGGTGKTYLLNLLLSTVRSHRQIAIALASTGNASTLLQGGRTAHSVLKLPLNLHYQEAPVCNISKNSDRAGMLRLCKLIVWDERSSSHKNAVDALDRTLRDLRNDDRTMVGLVVILAGDFRQTIPVIARGTPADQLHASIKSSPLWQAVVLHTLTTNMRVFLHNDENAANFSSLLLRIGDGLEPLDNDGNITLSPNLCCIENSTEDLIAAVFPDIQQNYEQQNWLCERAILAPTNDVVSALNDKILAEIIGDEKVYTAFNSVVNQDDVVNYPVEFLNSLELPGVPSQILKLEVGVPVLLLRNLNPPLLCNGTRICITQLRDRIIEGIIMNGAYEGTHVIIPQIPIIPTDLPFEFKRRQFPVRLAFAMTINKAQGQTLKVAGVHLEKPCFSHGQLYVACSRVSDPQSLHIYAPKQKTPNIVYQDALV